MGQRIAYSMKDVPSQTASITVVARNGTGPQAVGFGTLTSWR